MTEGASSSYRVGVFTSDIEVSSRSASEYACACYCERCGRSIVESTLPLYIEITSIGGGGQGGISSEKISQPAISNPRGSGGGLRATRIGTD